MRRTKDDQPESGAQQMGSSQADIQQQQQQQQGATPSTQPAGQAPRPVRYTDWASI